MLIELMKCNYVNGIGPMPIHKEQGLSGITTQITEEMISAETSV